jgi:hypothetical protein
MPRLPQSVSSLASRYASRNGNDESMSPIQRIASPVGNSPSARAPSPTVDTNISGREAVLGARASPISDEIARRRRRLEELEEIQLRERELELREREREIESKARELERDRARLNTVRGQSVYYADGSSVPPARTMSSQHLPSDPHPRHSQEAGRLVPPISTRVAVRDQPLSSSSQHTPRPSAHAASADHAPNCGCHSCSVEKYRQRDPSPSPRDLRPPEPPIQLRPEKPKGWIRRLSMPVVTFASSSESRTRKVSNSSMSNGISNLTVGSRASLAIVSEDGRYSNARWDQNNRSTTSLVGRR